MYRVERMRVGRAGFNDQDAITLNGKKLWLPERERENAAREIARTIFYPFQKIGLRDVEPFNYGPLR